MNWTQIFRENLNCYSFSMFRVFILLASSDSDKHMLGLGLGLNEAKSVNKDSPIVSYPAVLCLVTQRSSPYSVKFCNRSAVSGHDFQKYSVSGSNVFLVF